MSRRKDIEEMKSRRFQFLLRCYELSEGSELAGFNMHEVGGELGFDHTLTNVVTEYLVGERLIKYAALGGCISITHWGIRQIEAALSEPEAPTRYFPPVVNIVSAEQIIDSQIQQASTETIQVTIRGDNYQELTKLLESLKESIDQLGLEHEQQTDLLAQIQTIDAQMSSPRPSRTIVSESLRTARRILEEAAGGTLAAGFIEAIKALFSG